MGEFTTCKLYLNKSHIKIKKNFFKVSPTLQNGFSSHALLLQELVPPSNQDPNPDICVVIDSFPTTPITSSYKVTQIVPSLKLLNLSLPLHSHCFSFVHTIISTWLDYCDSPDRPLCWNGLFHCCWVDVSEMHTSSRHSPA